MLIGIDGIKHATSSSSNFINRSSFSWYGMERLVAQYSGDCIIAKNSGTVEKVDSGKIVVRKI